MIFLRNICTYISRDNNQSKLFLRLLLCLGLCLLTFQTVNAQKYVPTEMAKEKAEKEKTEKANRPKKLVYAVEKKNFFQKIAEDSTAWISGFQINVDLEGPIESLISSNKHFEAAVKLSLKDWFIPTVEVGYGYTDYLEFVTKTSYKCGGLYGRVGFDFNILKNKHDIYKLFVGMRVAGTSFKFYMSSPEAKDPIWKTDANFSVTDATCNYLWLEFLAGVDVKIVGPLHLGWTVRYKKSVSSSYKKINKAWYIPGYGKDSGSGFGATFTLGFDI